MGFVLFIIAFIFTSLLTILWAPISVIYHLITFKWKTGAKAVNLYFYQLALIIDVFANESLATLLNFVMIKGDKFLFGTDDRDTLSYVIAINYRRDTLTSFGLFWANFLDFVDKDHLEKAITYKIERYEKFRAE